MKYENYRLKISSPPKPESVTYITRQQQRVFYFDGKETPLALSNLVGPKAAELRFKLEDAVNGAAAAGHVRVILASRWEGNNKPNTPRVEVL